MASRRLLALLLCALALTACRRRKVYKPPEWETLPYPAARVVAQVDRYHDTRVADPYRWMEQMGSEEVRAWVEAQNRRTETFFLEECESERERIHRRLTELWDYERTSIPWREGESTFFRKNTGLQDQSALYVTDGLGEAPRLLLDPAEFAADGSVSLRFTDVSPDGRHVAYALSSEGSDWVEVRVRDVAAGTDLETDRLKWIKFSGAAWTPDGRGFFYTRLPAPQPGAEARALDLDPKIYFHLLGTPQEEDALVYERPDHPDWGLFGSVTEDGAFLVIDVYPQAAGANDILVLDLAGGGEVRELVTGFSGQHSVLGNDGRTFYLFTDRDSPKGRIVAVDLDDAAPEKWRTLVAEGRDALVSARIVGQRFVLRYLHLAHARVALHRLDGAFEREIPLPGKGSAWGFTGRRGHDAAWFGFTTFTQPLSVYRYDFATHRSELVQAPRLDHDPDRFVTEQVAYLGHRGQNVTMFLVHDAEATRDGRRPALIWAYGGFGSPMTPGYSPTAMLWLELGGVLAVPNLRGGGEYGEAWHRAGMRENKPNTIGDLIAAAESLAYNKVAHPRRIAAAGHSNGGLVVGAALVERPDLFGACVVSGGVLDMLRFPEFTVGRFWTGEFGSPDDPAQFQVLRSYSPYHNLRPGTAYPPTLVLCAEGDDRVVPLHSYKFAARIQACQEGEAPVLLRVERAAGHGAGTPLSKEIDEQADQYAFLARALRMRVPRRIGR